MSPFWDMPLAIGVVADPLGTPLVLIWQGRRHRVVALIERWRVDEGWWRGRAWREYLTLRTHTGLLLTIYHELPRGGWYLQRLYD